MKTLIFIGILFITDYVTGQVREYDIPEVIVSDSAKKSTFKILAIKRSSILELQPEDAGQLLQKLAGVTMKSYGGLGGFKTISVRSLGSQHTSIVVDGFTLSNPQTGQINLAQVQTENIEAMYLVTGAQKNLLAPASSQVSGSTVMIVTFENSFSSLKHKVRVASKMGSFGQYDNYLAYKLNLKRCYVSIFGKYRYANGDYPYSFKNGLNQYEGIRQNNKYEDLYSGISFGWRPSEKGIFTLNCKTDASDQELPGAVILYSQNTFQTLKTNNTLLQTAYVHYVKNFGFRAFTTASSGNLTYNDPSYLNSSGGINSTYKNEQIHAGLNFTFKLLESFMFFGGSEQQVSRLSTNIQGFGVPIRNHNLSIFGVKYTYRFALLTTQLSSQLIQDENDTIQREEVFKVNPFIQIETKELTKKLGITLSTFYRNSFRMPSFNELYYNNIGNSKLKPEEANQLSFGIGLSAKMKKFAMLNRSSVYFNQVNNKIVAIPTKNLFIWSMQNVGKVNITGVETSFELNYSLSEFWSFNSSLNYTYQSAIDITDKTSPTFGDQIAYIPKHTANIDFTVKRKNIGFRWSSFGNSLRYSLNENITSNEVEGFVISDVAVFNTFNLKKHDLRVQLSCKNIFNASYSIVRYYVMPGRNFLISLNYALN